MRDEVVHDTNYANYGTILKHTRAHTHTHTHTKSLRKCPLRERETQW